MTAYNVVRFKVKSGQEKNWLDAHQTEDFSLPGFMGGGMIKTGDRTYCFVGHWKDMESLAAARSTMVAMLDKNRKFLEDFGSGLGLTDPVSGSVVVDYPPNKK